MCIYICACVYLNQSCASLAIYINPQIIFRHFPCSTLGLPLHTLASDNMPFLPHCLNLDGAVVVLIMSIHAVC